MTTEDFLITSYKQLDAMKSQIKARYQEINAREPSPEELQRQCWDIWRLTTFYRSAVDAMDGDQDAPDEAPGHASYVPQEFADERTERIQAMDARLQEVLGDAVEVEETDDVGEDDDAEEFSPSADEQITMIEYGAIIYEWRAFVAQMNPVQIAPDAGDRGVVMNIVQHWFGGFDELMSMLYDGLMDRLRQAP